MSGYGRWQRRERCSSRGSARKGELWAIMEVYSSSSSQIWRRRWVVSGKVDGEDESVEVLGIM